MRTSLVAFAVCFAISIIIVGCGKSTDTPGATTGGGGGTTTATPLTAAQIAGTHYAPCLPVTDNTSYGSSMNGYEFYRSLTLAANGTYTITVFVFQGGTCPGGVEVAVYNQGGTFTLGSVMTAPSGATQILYTATSNQLTVYGGTSGGGTLGFGNGWVTTFNADCPGVAAFTSGASSSQSVSGHTCNVGGLGFPQFGTDGTSYYDSIALNSTTSPSVVTVSQSNDIFHMGQFASYPTTATFTYSF